jgi:hypothetical protein
VDEDPTEAQDDDQWLTSNEAYRLTYLFCGISKNDMIDATPLNRSWNQWDFWDVIREILRFMVWWLNPPWGKNCEFMPWVME